MKILQNSYQILAKQIAVYILKRVDKIVVLEHFIHYKNIVVKIKFLSAIYIEYVIFTQLTFKRDSGGEKKISNVSKTL